MDVLAARAVRRRKADCRVLAEFKGVGFLCKLCFRQVQGLEELRRHFVEGSHADLKLSECSKECGRLFSREEVEDNFIALVHQIKFSETGRGICLVCRERVRAGAFRRHLLEKHATENAFPCQICVEESRLHEEENYRDSIPMFKSIPQLKRHIRSSHGGRILSLWKDYSPDNGENGQSKWMCWVCQYVFELKAELTEHLKWHDHMLTNQCRECFEIFPSWADLLDHYKAQHADLIRLEQCPVCMKQMPRSHLVKHLEELHADYSQECKNICPICDFKAPNPESLLGHCQEHLLQNSREIQANTR